MPLVSMVAQRSPKPLVWVRILGGMPTKIIVADANIGGVRYKTEC